MYYSMSHHRLCVENMAVASAMACSSRCERVYESAVSSAARLRSLGTTRTGMLYDALARIRPGCQPTR